MNTVSLWFSEQLQSTADGMVWAARQVPSQRQFAEPPPDFGEWSVARHVFHLLYYEAFVVPIMQQWLGGNPPSMEGFDEDDAWDREPRDLEILVERFLDGRKKQIALLPEFEAAEWTSTRETTWGPVTLQWAVSKTFQHTAEHINAVMQMVLFWEFVAGSHENVNDRGVGNTSVRGHR